MNVVIHQNPGIFDRAVLVIEAMFVLMLALKQN